MSKIVQCASRGVLCAVGAGWQWEGLEKEETSYCYTGLLKTKEVIQIFIVLSPCHWSDIAADLASD